MTLIDELLTLLVERGGSDLHLAANHRPSMRVHGEMEFLQEYEVLTQESSRDLVCPIMSEHNLEQFETEWDTDFAYAIEGLGRFRVNAFMDRYGVGSVYRHIPENILTLEQLGLTEPSSIPDFCKHGKGLVIITGPTGSGKSTTMAAMVDLINRTRREHIITIEDPIEFAHESKGCLINQREVHRDTKSFSGALRAALREDPDIVLLGEMRDLETTEIALETAETGHLVLATLHTNTATSTIDRIIDKFPSGQQNQIRSLLSNTLIGIVAQTLCKRKGGGRIAATEVLVATNPVCALIRDKKTHQLPSALQTGANVGMQTFSDSLFRLVEADIIEPKEAYLKAVDKDSLLLKFKNAGIEFDTAMDELDSFGGSENAMQVSPKHLKHHAWKLALSDDPDVQVHAPAIAQRALKELHEEDKSAALIVLAATQAGIGDFPAATQTLKTAAEKAKSLRQRTLDGVIRRHTALYRKSKTLPADEPMP